MNLLLFSNSTNAGQEYLSYTLPAIKDFLGDISNVLFVPYAAITFSYDEYTDKVNTALNQIGVNASGIHKKPDKISAIEEAEAIVVGGGNTFHLLKHLQNHLLVDPLRKRVLEKIPYIGWSAGSNLACPTIRTTNDMPVVEPEGFEALNLIPFQINPHYLDANPDGHAGETRQQRIEEFLEVNPDIYVVGLREGTYLTINDSRIRLHGGGNTRIFKKDTDYLELSSRDKMDFLFA